MEKTYAIIPAAGRGIRMGHDRPKQYLDLDGKPILVHTLETFCRLEFLSGILLVVPKPFLVETRDLLRHFMRIEPVAGHDSPFLEGQSGWYRIEGCMAEMCRPPETRMPLRMVTGGSERQDSVFNGLSRLPPDCGWVMIHDGVRPFASVDLIRRTWEKARQTGACIAALPSTDTVKRVVNGEVAETLPRESVWLVQTPQVFQKDIIVKAYQEAHRRHWVGTDDASFVERLGEPVAVSVGERSNIKVTTPEDLEWGGSFLRRSRTNVQSGGDKGV